MSAFITRMSLPFLTFALFTLNSGKIKTDISSVHSIIIIFKYSSCQEKTGLCSFPSANVTLTHQRQLLKAGQPYNIILDLDLPESEANKQLGMFMVHLKLTGKEGKLIAHSRRTAMLRYKSYTLHLLSTMVFSPFLLAGPMEEKQTLKIEMFTDYLENRVRNAVLFFQPIQLHLLIFI